MRGALTAGPSEQAKAAVVPVAIYTRVSTDNQVGGRFDSCESQAAICRDQITRRSAEGWHEVACFTDAAYSGGSMNRPGIRALKRMIEAREVKIVLIYKLERVLRSTDEWIPFRGFLQQHGCRLESATEDLSENTPSGRLKNNLLMSVAEYERLNTAEKTRTKMHEQAKRGLWNGGNVPFGYTYDKNGQSLQLHPEESKVVARIYNETAKLVPLQEIANSLNAEGLRTKERMWRRRDGSVEAVGQRIFRSDGLRIIVRNPFYRGAVRFSGSEFAGKHPPLVSTELWEKANAAVAPVILRPAGRLQERDAHNHLLKGLVHCGCCRRRLVPTDSTKKAGARKVYRYYACGTLVKERQPCPVGRISADALERTVVSFLCEVSKHPDVAKSAIKHSETLKTKERPAFVAELAEIQKRLDAVAKKYRNCLHTVEVGGAEVFGPELKERAAKLRAEKDQLLVERERKRQQIDACDTTVLTEKRILAALEQLGEIFPKLAPNAQKEFIQLFVERIDVRKRAPKLRPAEPQEPVHQMEVTVRLHVPRLVEGMGEMIRTETTAHRAAGNVRAMAVEMKVDFSRAMNGEVTIHAPYYQMLQIGQRHRPQKPTPSDTNPAKHPLNTARRWQSLLDNGSVSNRAALARKFSLTRASITQYLDLLKLHPNIQTHLVKLRTVPEVRQFSLNKMRVIARMPPEEQLTAFSRLQRLALRLTAS